MSSLADQTTRQEQDYQTIAKLISLHNDAPEQLQNLHTLAHSTGLSEMQVQRLFSRWAGISPKRFTQYLTTQDIRARMNGQKSLFDLSLEAGLSSASRLHDHFIKFYAMTPAQVLEQGKGIKISHGFYPSPFGHCHIATTDKGICWLAFTDPVTQQESIQQLQAEWQNASLKRDDTQHQALVSRLFDAASHKAPLFLHIKGTNFQLRVWEALLKIPAGQCCQYEDIARQIAAPRAARAVGTAIGKNPISWLIPCHRVIRGTGVVGHYRWGQVRKQSLLVWEQGIFGR